MTDQRVVESSGGNPRDASHRLSGRVDWTKPFARLALTHASGMAGEALLAIALAGTLLFKVDPAQGRQRVLLGLLLTMAPFAIVGPMIGPVIDRVRGGHRAVIVGSMTLRVGLGFLMIWAVAIDSWSLFPAAFLMLVLGKTYQVAKAAVVPTVIHGDLELVEANSKLQILAGISGGLAAVLGGILFLISPSVVAAASVVCFVGASIASLQIPSHRVATSPPAPDEVAELRSAAVVLAATAMAVLRGIVGFVTFLLAFELRGVVELDRVEVLARNVARHANIIPRLSVVPIAEPPVWYFAVVVALGLFGGLTGAALAPRLRAGLPEERILAGSVGLAAIAGLTAAISDGLLAYASISFLVAVGATAGKQAFDALVQRDAPDANRGRSFARFEARFQVVWVIGAAIPVAIHMPFQLGGFAVATVGGFTALCYALGRFPQLSISGKSGTSGVSAGRSGRA